MCGGSARHFRGPWRREARGEDTSSDARTLVLDHAGEETVRRDGDEERNETDGRGERESEWDDRWTGIR